MTLVSCATTGLANRIKSLLSCWVKDDKAQVFWTINHDCSSKFSDLFTNTIEVSSIGSNPTYETWRLEVDGKLAVPEGFSSVREFYGTKTNWSDIDFEYNRIPEPVKNRFLILISRLKINPDILRKVNEFYLSQKFDKNTVSVHIQSWTDEADRNSKYYDINEYAKEITRILKENPKSRFYVSTDHLKSFDYLQKQFGTTLIFQFPQPKDVDPQLCLVELLLLSKNPTLIASHISTFSEMAWWFGGCSSNVVVVAKNSKPVSFNLPNPSLSKLTLLELGAAEDTDKVYHGFCNIYDNEFRPIRNEFQKIMELGVWFGASIRMWKNYFPYAEIHGVDHFTGHQGNGTVFANPMKYFDELKAKPDDRITLHNVDQTDLVKLCEMRDKLGLGTFDMILDDASHIMKDQQQTFAVLFPLLKPGGYFVIEDVQCSEEYPYYGILPDGSNTTLKMILNFKKLGEWKSLYLTQSQTDFLNQNTLSCDLKVNAATRSKTCLIRRK